MSHPTSHPDRSFPRLHPRPATGWLNDPNGIHHAGGRWHMFFQYNPESARHEQITWGQLSSPDLVHWEDHGVALRPQPGAADELGCWSGVAVIDDGIPILVYSGVRDIWGHSDVMLACPEGTGWVQSDHIAAPMPESRRVLAVRDPFLFEYAGRRWGLLGASHAPGIGAILAYDASDLNDWQERGVLVHSMHPVSASLPPVNMWECPQLVQVGEDWVLIISLWLAGYPAGVSYLIGSLAYDEAADAPQFTPRAGGTFEDGACFYAPQAVQAGAVDGGPERVLVWGWARETVTAEVRGRSEEEADAVGWSGSLTFPRELVVDGDLAYTVPARELAALRGDVIAGDVLPDQAEVLLEGSGHAELRLSADGETGQLVWAGELADSSVRMLIDASVIEIFPRRATSITQRAYPADGENYRLVLDPGVRASAWELRLA